MAAGLRLEGCRPCGLSMRFVYPVRSPVAPPPRAAPPRPRSNVSRETFSGERLTGGRATGTISSRADEAFPVG